jgi:hypothetical protein
MKDTIGGRISKALSLAAETALLRKRRFHTAWSLSASKIQSFDREIAKAEGAAAGHAFRAAEIAYDMGRIDENERLIRAGKIR